MISDGGKNPKQFSQELRFYVKIQYHTVFTNIPTPPPRKKSRLFLSQNNLKRSACIEFFTEPFRLYLLLCV